jgi:hypothetical protein
MYIKGCSACWLTGISSRVYALKTLSLWGKGVYREAREMGDRFWKLNRHAGDLKALIGND